MSAKRSLLTTPLLLLLGCGAAPDADNAFDVAPVTQELNGTAVFPDSSCTDAQKDKLRAALREASNLTHGSRDLLDPYATCLRRSIVSADLFADIDMILDQIGEDLPTRIKCANLTNAIAQAPLNLTGKEELTYDRTSLDNTSNTKTIAGVILHEVAHNKNFNHHKTSGNDDYRTTVPVTLDACASNSVVRGRQGASSESAAAAMGVNLGSFTPAVHCFANMVANGLKVRFDATSQSAQAIGFKCRTPKAQTVADTALSGNTAGTVTDLACSSNEVLVGVQARRDSSIFKSLSPICASESDVRAKNTNAIVRGTVGSGSITPISRRCPAGMAVKSFRGRAISARLVQMEITCHDLDGAMFPKESMLANSGVSTDGSSADVALETCARRGAVRGLHYNVGSVIDRLGGECDGVFTACTGGVCEDASYGLDVHALSSHGGFGGSPMKDVCPSQHALVGMDVTFGPFGSQTAMTSIKGKCARIADWSVPSRTATITDLPQRGNGGGTLTQHMCARGQSIRGWKIMSFDLVNGLRPICRDF